MSHRYRKVQMPAVRSKAVNCLALRWAEKTVLHAVLFHALCPYTSATHWRIGDHVFCIVYAVGLRWNNCPVQNYPHVV